MSLDGVVSAAVDSAASAASAEAPESPSGIDTTSSPAESSAASVPGSAPPSTTAASPGSGDVSSEPAASSVPPTTRAAAPGAKPESPSSPEKPPPAGRWPQVLENARVKERTATRDQVFSTYGLDESLDATEVKAHLDLLRRDPQLHAELTIEALKREGRYRPRQEDTPEQVMPQPRQPMRLPEPALLSTDGQRAFTADQVLEVLHNGLAQFRAELSGELQPLREMHQDARTAQIRADAYSYANEAIREASSWHGFDKLRGRIKEIMLGDRRSTLLSAYNRALQEDLKTSNHQLRTETRRQTLEEIQQASEANTIRPGVNATGRASTRAGRGGLEARLDRAVAAAVASVAR